MLDEIPWRDYVTTLPWGIHPAGTKCQARRRDGFTVVLRFDDGTQVEARGYYLKGIEETRTDVGTT